MKLLCTFQSFNSLHTNYPLRNACQSIRSRYDLEGDLLCVRTSSSSEFLWLLQRLDPQCGLEGRVLESFFLARSWLKVFVMFETCIIYVLHFDFMCFFSYFSSVLFHRRKECFIFLNNMIAQHAK